MKVLQVTTVATTLNAFLLPFAKAFKQQGWNVDAAASDILKFDDVIATHDKCYDIQFCRNPLKIRRLFQSLAKIRHLLKQQKYDVVHVHTPIAAFLTRLAAVGVKNTKIFYTAHGFHYVKTNPFWKNVIFLLLEKFAGLRTDHLFVINQDDLCFAQKAKIVPKESITFIRGIGVNPELYEFNKIKRQLIRDELNVLDSTFLALHVAELNDNKNHEVVLNALSKFVSAYPNADFRYVIVGEGSKLERLQQMAKVLGVNAHVIFLGYRNDISSLISACDTLILSSKREGLPRCMLEAMCAKKPIIASNIRGCSDLLCSGAGLLVEYNNIEQWHDAIYEMYSNPESRENMGLIGYSMILNEYQEEKVINAVLNVYKREHCA